MMSNIVKKLDGFDALNLILLKELKEIIYFQKAPYIKFLLLMNSIEYIGASYDSFPYTETKHSEERFNIALKKLFPNKYNKYAKENSKIYFYDHLRCGLIHQFRPLISQIHLTTRKEAIIDGNKHLEGKDGNIFLVLEDFYDDLEKAVIKLISLSKEGKFPSTKLKNNFLQIHKSDTGTTEK